MLIDVTNDLSYTCTAPWVRMGEYNDGYVVLKKMVFNRFLLINTPFLPFTLVVYSACQASNPQPFNVCLKEL